MNEIVSKIFRYILATIMVVFAFSLCWSLVYIIGKIVMTFLGVGV